MTRFPLLLLLLAVPAAAQAPKASNPELEATLKDIETTLGTVPGFLKSLPPAALPGAWEEMKGLQLNPNTAIPAKYKELIGLGVSAQVPCRYCVYAHTEFAKLHGATMEEVNWALAEAALTRHWSTFLNGYQQDEAAFKTEVARAVDAMKKSMAAPPPAQPPAPAAVTDRAGALKDMEMSMGLAPSFMRAFPEEGLVGAWKQMKAIEMNPASPVPQKYISLVSLGVAAQIPCRYCVIADSEFAKVGGATDRERYEAIAMSSITRYWSTYLNGVNYDENKFKKEVDQIVAHTRKKMGKQAAK